jgi:hypothetical protein
VGAGKNNPYIFVFPDGTRKWIVTDGSPVWRIFRRKPVEPFDDNGEESTMNADACDEIVFERVAIRYGVSKKRYLYIVANLCDQQKIDAIAGGEEPSCCGNLQPGNFCC